MSDIYVVFLEFILELIKDKEIRQGVKDFILQAINGGKFNAFITGIILIFIASFILYHGFAFYRKIKMENLEIEMKKLEVESKRLDNELSQKTHEKRLKYEELKLENQIIEEEEEKLKDLNNSKIIITTKNQSNKKIETD